MPSTLPSLTFPLPPSLPLPPTTCLASLSLLAASSARDKGLAPLAETILRGGRPADSSSSAPAVAPETAARRFVRQPEVPSVDKALAGTLWHALGVLGFLLEVAHVLVGDAWAMTDG